MGNFLINIINNSIKGMIKMSLFLDKQQEIADRMLPKELTIKGIIQALKAKVAELLQIISQKDEIIAQQAEEIDTLQEALANIGTPQQLEQILAPVELQQDENIQLGQ